MPNLPTLTLQAARMLVLEAQGLRLPPARPAVKADVPAAIRRMGALQIDTISVVARSPYLSLWSRLGAYDPAWLDESLAEGQIFEYWAHAACFLPAEDYLLHRRLMLDDRRLYFGQPWFEQHRNEVEAVLAHVRGNGAVRSADFTGKKNPGGWWNWKMEKRALEYWFARGELMVARRRSFQRVYDLRERVRPGWDDGAVPPMDEVLRRLALRSVGALGIARPAWVADYFHLKKTEMAPAVQALTREGRLLEVPVDAWPEPALVLPEHAGLVEQAAAGELQAEVTTLLTPFDSLVWDRARTRQMFGFDFTIECYVPAPKRIYGYYLLPVLHRGALVARMDVKAHRKEKVFEVRALHWEPGIDPAGEMREAVMAAVQRCADWHATPEVRLTREVQRT